MEMKKRRKTLNKKLKAIQTDPDRWIHEMDDVMFNSVREMLKSQTATDIEMARDIIFKSKMSLLQIHTFTNDEYMCNVILNSTFSLAGRGHTYSTWSFGNITI